MHIVYLTQVTFFRVHRAIGNSGNRNRKQKMEIENDNGKIWMYVYTRVKPLIDDHLCAKTIL